MNRALFLIFILTSFVWRAEAAEAPLSPNEVARLMGYPEGVLRVQETTDKVNEREARKKRPLVISAHSYTSEDGSFAPLYIAIGKAGSLLTPELKEKFDDSLKDPVLAGPLQRINEKGIGTGFIGIGMPGQGGDVHMSLLTLPSLNLDIQAILAVPQKMPERSGAEAYLSQLRSESVKEMLKACVVTKGRQLIDQAGNFSENSYYPSDVRKKDRESESQKSGAGQLVHDRQDASHLGYPRWIFALGGVVALVIFGLLTKRFMRRNQ